MRPAFRFLAPLLLLPLACTDTPVEPETEETASFKAEKPPKDYGDWLVVDVQCSGPHSSCIATIVSLPVADDWAYDCQHRDGCDNYLPYIETPAGFMYSVSVWDDEGPVCHRWEEDLDISVLDSGPLTRYCVGGDNIVGKITVTRVIND